ncbi:MAG TPA: hypothetical protein VGN09_27515, partial [Vicinamibacteria bacterium]
MKITHASILSDRALIDELNRLAGRERAATVALIVHLSGKSKQQVEELLARRFPHSDVPSSIRSLPVSASLGTKRNEYVTALPEVAACGPPGADSPPAAL